MIIQVRIEKINNEQIRCTLSQQDLIDRHIQITELAYGSPKAKRFFHDMMQQASYELGFNTENIPLMIEAVPTGNDSIVLLISKVRNTDELDGHFSSFTRSEDDEDDGSYYGDMDTEAPSLSFLDNFADEEDEEDEDFDPEDEDDSDSLSYGDSRNAFSGYGEAPADADREAPHSHDSYYRKAPNHGGTIALSKEAGMDHRPAGTEVPSSRDVIRVFSFRDLDSVSRLAAQLMYTYTGQNTLYKDEKKHKFYLVLHKSEHTSIQFTRICNTVSEYGTQENNSYAAAQFFEEHYKPFIKDTALQVLGNL